MPKGVYTRTAAMIASYSTAFKKGHSTPNNWREKIAQANLGNSNASGKRTEEQKQRISEARKGKGVGENNGNWKGGISSEDYKERRRFREALQVKIFARDNYTCQICDAYGSPIQIDHIQKWSEFPELRFDMNNCRTVCMACHYYVTFKRKLPQGVVWGHNLSKRISK